MTEENKAPEAPVAVVKDTKNGITRPKAETKTGRVWAIADENTTEDAAATRKVVLDQAVSEEINPATAATQYGRWRKYHGLEGTGREEAAVVPEAPAVPEAEETTVE